MLSAGYATTYEQSGAEYGRWGKEQFLQYEQLARSVLLFPLTRFSECGVNLKTTRISSRAAKRGMWASKTALESPSEYKKRYREGNVTSSDPGSNTINKEIRSISHKQSKSWTRFLPFWR